MRLVPEEAVARRLARERGAEIAEVVAIGIRIEAGVRQLLAGEGGDLTVLHVVLQELRDLLAAEVLAVAPRIDEDAQPQLVRLVDDLRDVRTPEVEVELGDGEDHLRDPVRLHLGEVRLRVLHVVQPVVADACLLDCHLPVPFLVYLKMIVRPLRAICTE